MSTYSTINYGPTGFEDETPYMLAVVEFEDGIKIFGRLSKDISESDVKVGMGLRAVPVKLPVGRISCQFQKA